MMSYIIKSVLLLTSKAKVDENSRFTTITN